MSLDKTQAKSNNNIAKEKEKEKNIQFDSFNKIFNLQKLILKHAGLKQICKKKIT